MSSYIEVTDDLGRTKYYMVSSDPFGDPMYIPITLEQIESRDREDEAWNSLPEIVQCLCCIYTLMAIFVAGPYFFLFCTFWYYDGFQRSLEDMGCFPTFAIFSSMIIFSIVTHLFIAGKLDEFVKQRNNQ